MGLVPEGTVFRSQTASLSNLSRISQLNMPGFSLLYSSIFFSTSGVVTCFKRTGRQALVPSTLGQTWWPYRLQARQDAPSRIPWRGPPVSKRTPTL